MTHLKHKLIIAAIATSAGLYAGMTSAASVTATANALVITPLSIAENVQMDFGTIAGGAAAGTVVLDTAGARTTTGDATTIAAGAGAAGDFTITGEPLQAYSLSITSAANNLISGANTMTSSTYTDNSTGTMPGGGSETFQVGATLAVGASQAGGVYAGSYTVTVDYP